MVGKQGNTFARDAVCYRAGTVLCVHTHAVAHQGVILHTTVMETAAVVGEILGHILQDQKPDFGEILCYDLFLCFSSLFQVHTLLCAASPLPAQADMHTYAPAEAAGRPQDTPQGLAIWGVPTQPGILWALFPGIPRRVRGRWNRASPPTLLPS